VWLKLSAFSRAFSPVIMTAANILQVLLMKNNIWGQFMFQVHLSYFKSSYPSVEILG
jgi:hypothetical protein